MRSAAPWRPPGGVALGRQQMVAEPIELARPFFREEDPGPLQLHRRLRSGDRLSEPEPAEA
jgi:hypothetical protein